LLLVFPFSFGAAAPQGLVAQRSMEEEDSFRPSPEMQNLAIMKEEDSFRPSPEMENLAIMKDEFLEQSLEGLASQSLETFASLQGQPEQSISKVTVEDVEKEMKRLELELQKRGVDWSNEEEVQAEEGLFVQAEEGLFAIPELPLMVRSASLPDVFRRESSPMLTDDDLFDWSNAKKEPEPPDMDDFAQGRLRHGTTTALGPAQQPFAEQLDEILVAIAGTDRSPGPRVCAPLSAAASGDLEEPSGDFDEVVVEGLEAEPLVDALPEDVAAKEALASFRGRSDNSIGFGDAMRSLDTYAKGSKSREHDQETFHSHLQTSVRVGCWTLILALPIIIWPVAVHLKSMGRSESEYLSFWGSMLLQFLFCIGPTLGASVQYTVEGFFGTTIATVNMFFLNYVMGFWLRGGAFANRLEIFDPETSTTMIRSRWLPLCSNSNDYSFENCFLNIDLDRVEGAELAKALFVLADLVLVVFVVLSIGFNLNTRVFGLSTHVYFVMSFLDPNTGSFYTAPTLATHYWIIVACASFAVLLCFLIPFPITSYAKAHKMAEGSGLAVAMILESLPLTSTELCREKVQSAIEEADVVFADLDYHLRVMWFEDFGFGSRAVRRRWLQAYVEALKESKRHAGAVLHAAAAVPRSETERFRAALPSLRRLLSLVGSSLRTSHFTKSPADLKDLCRLLEEKQAVLLADLAVEFRGAQVPGAAGLTPPSLVFALALCGIVKDTSHAVRCLELWERKSQEEDEEVPGFGCFGLRGGSRRCLKSVWKHYNSILYHFDFKLRVSVVTHPRFVLRNTFTIFIAFMLGWIGVSNTLASYSSGPASTASVIMYTFTGASLPITLKRLNGVVLGAVIGSVAQRLFAIQSIGHAICYGVFIIAFVSFFIFHALHSKQNANVACLTVGYGISAMMPPGGIMRELAVKVNSSSNSSLFARVVGTVLGVLALMFVDALLASSARHQARQRLVRSLNLTSKLVAKVLSPGGAAGEEKEQPGSPQPKSERSDSKSMKSDQRRCFCFIYCPMRRKSAEDSKSENENDEDTSGADLSRALKEDLNELVALLPHAAQEPGRGVDMFRSDLYAELEKGLRTLAEHFGTLGWAIQLLETPQRRRILRAGSFAFSDKMIKKENRPSSPSATPLMRTEMFKPILATLGNELQLMLANIAILAEDLTQERHLAQRLRPKTDKEEERDAEAEKVREVLQEKLYTRAVGSAFSRIAVSPWRAAWNTAKGSAAARTARTAYQKAQEAKKRNELVSNERLLSVKKLLGPAAQRGKRAPLQRSASDPLLAAKEAGLDLLLAAKDPTSNHNDTSNNNGNHNSSNNNNTSSNSNDNSSNNNNNNTNTNRNTAGDDLHLSLCFCGDRRPSRYVWSHIGSSEGRQATIRSWI